MTRVRWGVAGTGGIAGQFAKALRRVDDAELLGACSRTDERAARFARQHEIPRAFGSLEAMVAVPDIDIVYVASPHSEHCAQALVALAAGKHVLVEKPFALSAGEAKQVLDAAAGTGLFVMEALWTRFLPAYVRLRDLVTEGAIGKVQHVEGSFGLLGPAPSDPTHRLLNASLGGGALLDMGVYPLQLALMLLGVPADVTGTAVFGDTGVDVNTVVGLRFDDGAVATASCSLVTSLPTTARITGEQGWIAVPRPMMFPDSLAIRRFGDPTDREVLELPVGGDGLRYQVAEVHRVIAAGGQQSEIMSWQHTLDLMTTLDRARAAIGLRYPGEQMRYHRGVPVASGL